jgi:ParB family chromosome partitioning protein
MAAKNKFMNAMKMPAIADMFSSEADRQRESGDLVTEVPLSELHPFVNHPFEVRDDEDMQKLVDSIKENGVLTNLTVRPRAEGGYEIISGHRRFHAAQLAGLDKIKVQVRNVDDDQAIIDMVDANIQREHISPMEKARALKMKNEALKRSAGRPKGNWGQLDPNFPKPRTKEILEGTGESAKQVQRYIRLNELIPELQKKVDSNTLKFNPAVELSYLTPDEQQSFLDYAEAQDCTPSLSQAQKLKVASKEGTLTPDKLEEIMSAQKPSAAPREPVLNINVSKVAQYFPTGCTRQQMENRILKILESYFRQMAHEQAHEEER